MKPNRKESDMETGIWISGFVSGLGLSVIVWTVMYLLIDTVTERRDQ